jgi:hypothetical protein
VRFSSTIACEDCYAETLATRNPGAYVRSVFAATTDKAISQSRIEGHPVVSVILGTIALSSNHKRSNQMKRIALLLSFVTTISVSCSEGPQGPAGPAGPTGPQGPAGADGLLAQIFEVELDFTAASDYQALVEFPAAVEVFATDIVVAYVLAGIDNDTDIWEPLPRTLFFGSDILLYGYDYTLFDINFFMDGTLDLTTLDPIYTDGLIFRVAIIPADFAASLNLSDMNQVMDALQIDTVTRVN